MSVEAMKISLLGKNNPKVGLFRFMRNFVFFINFKTMTINSRKGVKDDKMTLKNIL